MMGRPRMGQMSGAGRSAGPVRSAMGAVRSATGGGVRAAFGRARAAGAPGQMKTGGVVVTNRPHKSDPQKPLKGSPAVKTRESSRPGKSDPQKPMKTGGMVKGKC